MLFVVGIVDESGLRVVVAISTSFDLKAMKIHAYAITIQMMAEDELGCCCALVSFKQP
jgi:hypothetical protein